jgi:DOMON domain/Eukaryotic cytochrome b561
MPLFALCAAAALSLVLLSAGPVVAAVQPGEYAQSYTTPDTDMTLHWRPNVAAQQIDFAIEGKCTGWVSVGFGTGMLGSDIAYARVQGGTPAVQDRWSTGTGLVPTIDTQQDFFNVSGDETAGVTTVRFSRAMNTGDPNSQDVTLTGSYATPDAVTPMILAYQATRDSMTSAGLDAHTKRYQGVNVKLFQRSGCSSPCGPGTCVNSACVCGANAAAAGSSCACNSGFIPTAAGTACEAEETEDASEVEGFPAKVQAGNGKITLYWKFNEEQTEITIGIVAETTGWVAFGIGKGMSDADIVQGSVDASGKANLLDRHSTGQAEPTTDSKRGILASGGEESGGKTTIVFRRKIEADTDAEDKEIPAEKGVNTPVILAFAGDDSFSTQHSTKDAILVDFGSGGSTDLKTVHAVLMTLAWGVFVTIAWFLARFFKSIGHAWFIAHAALMSVAVLVTIVAFIIAVIMVDDDFAQANLAARAHSIIGLITVILSVAQPVIGVLADRMFDPDREKAPIFPDIVHQHLGHLLILLSVVLAALGIVALETYVLFVVWGIWLVVVIAAYIGLVIREKRNGGDGH